MQITECQCLWTIQKECEEDSHRWFPATADDPKHHLIALAGEVGELCNLYKKYDRTQQDHHVPTVDRIPKDEVAGELADILIYLCDLASLFNVNLAQAYYHKQQVNAERFG